MIYKKYFTLVTLSFFFFNFFIACGNSRSNSDSGDPNALLTIIGEEENNCNIVGVDATAITVGSDNSVGFNLVLEENISVEFDGNNYQTLADTTDFKLFDSNDDEVPGASFTLVAVPATLNVPITDSGDLSVPNLSIFGLTNPDTDTIYKLSIPEESITCESGEKNTAAYEVEFVLTPSTTDYSACGDAQEVKCE